MSWASLTAWVRWTIFEGNPLRDIQCRTKAVFVGGKQVVGE